MDTKKRIVIVAGKDAGQDPPLLSGCEQAGFAVQTCRDGLEGLLTFSNLSETVAAVVCDVRMPEFNGAWLVRQLRLLSIELPVILTGSYTDIDLWRVYDLGADAFLSRPADPDTVRDTLLRITAPTALSGKVRSVAIDNSIELTVPERPSRNELDGFRPGRRGFSIECTDESLCRGQLISFSVRQGTRSDAVMQGTGIIRWIRCAGAGSGLRTVGVEFTWLDQDSLVWLRHYVDTIRPAAAIPAAPSHTFF